MSLLATYHKIKVNSNRTIFSCDHFGEMWEQASEDYKRFLLRTAFLQENPEPKHWGAYSKLEKSTLHSFGLWMEEFADFQKSLKRKTKLFEKRINVAD